jgi:hypothetical protein
MAREREREDKIIEGKGRLHPLHWKDLMKSEIERCGILPKYSFYVFMQQ